MVGGEFFKAAFFKPSQSTNFGPPTLLPNSHPSIPFLTKCLWPLLNNPEQEEIKTILSCLLISDLKDKQSFLSKGFNNFHEAFA